MADEPDMALLDSRGEGSGFDMTGADDDSDMGLRNLSMQFVIDNQAALRDILLPCLRPADVGRLACVCRTFRVLALGGEERSHRRPKLRVTWTPHFHLGLEPAMIKQRLIKSVPTMETVYTNEKGQVLTMDVPPGTAIDRSRTRLDVDLVDFHTRSFKEHVYSKPFWKLHLQKPPTDPQTIKFSIQETLSHYAVPPQLLCVRFCLAVYTDGHAEPGYYTCYSPSFWVVTSKVPRKLTPESIRQRTEGPAKRSRHV